MNPTPIGQKDRGVWKKKGGRVRCFRGAFLALVLVIPMMVMGAVAQETPIDQALDQISRLNYSDAVSTLESHLNKQPEEARAWYLLGLCRNRLELYEEAYAALTNATAYGAETPDLHRELGYALQGLERWAAALHHLRDAGEKDGGAWLARGQVLVKMKKYDRALQALSTVLELDRELESTARLLRARIYAAKGKTKQARSELKTGLRVARRSDMKSAYRNLDKLLVLLDEHVLRLYNGIFYRETVDEDRGVVRRERRDPQLKELLTEAYTAFQNEVEEENRNPEAFRQFVQERDRFTRTARLLSNLLELFEGIDQLNLSDPQIRNLHLMMMRGIAPEPTNAEFLVDAVRTSEGNE